MMRGSARAPATLSNIGPGFDVLGMALDGPTDGATATLRNEPGITVLPCGPYGDRVPIDPEANVAAYAASRVLLLARSDRGLDLEVEKQIPPGSGLGSSAASAVAGAIATARALEMKLDPQALLPIVRDAEKLAAGSAHLDNVAPALLGGFVAVTQTDPPQVTSLKFPKNWSIAVALPAHAVETKKARAVLPREIPLADAIGNLRDLAALIDAAARGDLATFAAHLQDRLATPYRLSLWPFLEPARDAALEAGAPAWVVSGSGPAMFAPCADKNTAAAVVASVKETLQKHGFASSVFVARAAAKGAMEIEP